MKRTRGMPAAPMDRKQPTNKERSNLADRSSNDRHARERRSGQGADSALANLKSIERDRAKSKPSDDGGSSD